MEWFYRQHHPEYKVPAVNAKGEANDSPMEFIYPESGAVIYIPRQLDGSIQGVTFNLAHRNPSSTVFWHLDNEYVGETSIVHQMALTPGTGKHTVTVVDESGNTVSVGFTIEENSDYLEGFL
jgi:penicillin-binding protein 1C